MVNYRGQGMGRSSSGKLYGSIESRKSKTGVLSWRYRWLIPDETKGSGWRRVSSPWHDDLSEIQKLQLKITIDKRDGKIGHATKLKVIVDREVDKHLLRQISCAEFFTLYKGHLRTRRRQADDIDLDLEKHSSGFRTELNWLERFFDYAGVETMGDLTAAHITEFKARRAMDSTKRNKKRLVANSTINREIQAILPMLRYAYRLNYLMDEIYLNPGKLSEASNKEVVVFQNLADIVAVFKTVEAVAPDFLPLWWFYMGTGARQGEGIKFKKTDVSPVDKVCKINSKKTGGQRTDKWRRVKLAWDIHALILAACQHENNQSEFAFVDATGKPWSKAKIKTRIKAVRDALQVDTDDGGYGWSDTKADTYIKCGVARHTYGSIVYKMMGMEEAAAQLGHSDSKTTSSYYVNCWLDYVKQGDLHFPYNVANRTIHGARCGAIRLPDTMFEVSTGNSGKYLNLGEKKA